jgi:hypothetical protein
METPPPNPERWMFEPPEKEKRGGSFKLGVGIPLLLVIIGLLLHIGQIVAPVLFCAPILGVVFALFPSSSKFGLGILVGGLAGWILIIPMCEQGLKGIN